VGTDDVIDHLNGHVLKTLHLESIDNEYQAHMRFYMMDDSLNFRSCEEYIHDLLDTGLTANP